MTTRPEIRALEAGRAFAEGLIPEMHKLEAHFATDGERLLWWAAIMGTLGGACAASLGMGSLQAIEEMTTKTTTKVLKENTQ